MARVCSDVWRLQSLIWRQPRRGQEGDRSTQHEGTDTSRVRISVAMGKARGGDDKTQLGWGRNKMPSLGPVGRKPRRDATRRHRLEGTRWPTREDGEHRQQRQQAHHGLPLPHRALSPSLRPPSPRPPPSEPGAWRVSAPAETSSRVVKSKRSKTGGSRQTAKEAREKTTCGLAYRNSWENMIKPPQEAATILVHTTPQHGIPGSTPSDVACTKWTSTVPRPWR